jgi:hypothetical protein
VGTLRFAALHTEGEVEDHEGRLCERKRSNPGFLCAEGFWIALLRSQ